MAHDHLRQIAEFGQPVADVPGIRKPETEPVHAGVEMQRRREGFVMCEADVHPLLEHFQRTERRHQPVGEIEIDRAWIKTVQNEDMGIGQGTA